MPGVSFTDPLVKLALVSGAEWTVTLSDVLLTLGILLLLAEVIKGARPGAKYVTDHLLSLIVFGAAAAEFVMWPKFGTSTFFLLTALALVDFLSGLALRSRRRAVAVAAPAPSRKGAAKAEAPAPEPEPRHLRPPPHLRRRRSACGSRSAGSFGRRIRLAGSPEPKPVHPATSRCARVTRRAEVPSAEAVTGSPVAGDSAGQRLAAVLPDKPDTPPR